MYWGDAKLDKIEKARIDGSGRRTWTLIENDHHFAFLFREGNIYITDWNSPYDCLVSSAVKSSERFNVKSISTCKVPSKV